MNRDKSAMAIWVRKEDVLTIDKLNVIKSGDGTMMTVYLSKDKDSVVRQINKDGTISKSYNIKNDKLIGFYMKNAYPVCQQDRRCP